MVKNHLKRLHAPATWNIPRKSTTFVARPLPGAHAKQFSMPLSTLLKEEIPLFPTLKLLKHAINAKQVLVDGKPSRTNKAAPGLMDVLSFPDLGKHYRITITAKGKLGVVEVPAEEARLKVVKINNKRSLGKDWMQYNLSDGRNILAKEQYKTGDSLLLELPGQRIQAHYPLKAGSWIFVYKGQHIGATGTVSEIKEQTVLFKRGDETHETKREFIIVIGKDAPAVSVTSGQQHTATPKPETKPAPDHEPEAKKPQKEPVKREAESPKKPLKK